MEACPHIRGLESVKNDALFTPRMWACSMCGTTESVWACLQCSNIACGRFNEEHAVKHFSEKGHPLALEVNKKYLYCYQCDGYVFNDNSYEQVALIRETLKEIETQVFNESLTRSGCVIRGASTPKLNEDKRVEKEQSKLEDKQYTAVCHWRLSLLTKVFNGLRKNIRDNKEEKGNSTFSEAKVDKKEPPRKRRKVIIPGVTGLRNLGNTCYMNSVLQVLSHLQFFRQCFLLLNKTKVPEQPCYTSTPKNSHSLNSIFRRQTTVECYEHITMPLRKGKTWPRSKREKLQANIIQATSKEEEKEQLNSTTEKDETVGNVQLNAQLEKKNKSLQADNCTTEVNEIESVQKDNSTTNVNENKSMQEDNSAKDFNQNRILQLENDDSLQVNKPITKAKNKGDEEEMSFKQKHIGDLSLGVSEDGLLDRTLPVDQSLDDTKESNMNDDSRKITSDCEQSKQVFFSDELHALFRVMWSGKWAIVTPLAVLHAVWHLIPSFLGYSQHDAQEFLCEVLERLQRELEEHYPINFHGSRSDVIEPKDILPNVFEGKLVSEVMCHNCRAVSTTCEQFWDLSLEFPDRYQVKPRSSRGRLPPRRPSMESCHLTELLAKFTQSELLEGRSYRCDKCCASSPDSLQFAQKQLQIGQLPEVLRLHLKRFRWYCQMRGKIISHVGFDMELDMKAYCHSSYFTSYSDQDFLYSLSGVIIHLGTGFDSGHYVAYCWNEEAGSWVYYNDARVSLCSDRDVLKSQAYILLYTRCNGRTQQSNIFNNFTIPKTP